MPPKSPIDSLKTADFHYELPPELIAQHPAPTRDGSRLLVANRTTSEFSHQHFSDLSKFLRGGDVLVLNNSRVIPARLRGQKKGGQAAVEILLTEAASEGTWWAMLRPGKRLPPGTRIALHDRTGQPTAIEAEVIEKNEQGHARLLFNGTENIIAELEQLGELPLPPYIQREAHHQTDDDIERYQTVYANPAGSIAAPTAGLHFTYALLNQLRAKGIQIHSLTLHVGLGTFAPVKAESIAEHKMHTENFSLPQETANAINTAKAERRRVIAVGTTTVRVLESLAQNEKPLAAAEGGTDIFIFPPRDFRVVDALLTNFHLPQSTLLMLVSAFAAPGEMRGREWILENYAEAAAEKYRFFSFGDAMFIT